MSDAPIILTMKWGSLFSADYVTVLHSACRAASQRTFRFVCLNDDATGLLPGIEALPLPDCGLGPDDWYRPGIWRKIGLYQRNLTGLRGRALFIDLDMMVLRELDSFFDLPAPFITTDMGGSWRPEGGTSRLRQGPGAVRQMRTSL